MLVEIEVEGEVTGVVEVGDRMVDVTETLPVLPIMTMEEGKVSCTVAYPCVSLA